MTDMNYIITIQKNDEYITDKVMLKNFCKTAGLKYPKLDVSATKKNTKCRKYFTIKDDALTKEWNKPYFCNAPYSRMEEFLKYGIAQTKKHKVIGLFLLFVKTDTRYWLETIFPTGTIYWVNGRLQFGTDKGSKTRCKTCGNCSTRKTCCKKKTSKQNAPYGSAWVIFEPRRHVSRYNVVDRNGLGLVSC